MILFNYFDSYGYLECSGKVLSSRLELQMDVGVTNLVQNGDRTLHISKMSSIFTQNSIKRIFRVAKVSRHNENIRILIRYHSIFLLILRIKNVQLEIHFNIKNYYVINGRNSIPHIPVIAVNPYF